MCQGRKCFRSRCAASHDQAYKKQPWFAGDEDIWQDDVKYVVRLAWSNPYNTEAAPTFNQEELKEINEYVATSGQCWDMCLGKPCSFGEKCHFQHHRAYRSQPWFTSDEHEWEDDVKYTWRTEKPKIRKSERNKGEKPIPDKFGKTRVAMSYVRTSNMSTGPRTKETRRWYEPAGEYQRGNLPQAVPENSSSKQSQPAEAPEEAPASKEERKEAPSSTPSSEQQNQPAETEETKEESMSPKTSPKASQADNHGWMFNMPNSELIISEHDTDDDLVEETEDQRQARIEERNANATAQNMPKYSTPTSRHSWGRVWLQEWERIELAAEEEQNKASRIKNRPSIEQYKDALKILGLGYLDPKLRTEERAAADFKRLMFKYATDKMKLENSEMNDPQGEDCSTPELRKQAWTTRMQRIVGAKDNFTAGNKYGVQ